MIRRPPRSTLFPYTTLSDLENLPRFAWSTPQRQKLKFLPLRRYNLTLNLLRSEERFSRNAETDLVCRLLLEKKKKVATPADLRLGRVCRMHPSCCPFPFHLT